MIRYFLCLLSGSLLLLVLPSRNLAQPLQKLAQPRLDADGLPLPAGAIARLGSQRFRHRKPIAFLRFTDANRKVLSVSQDGNLRLWEVSNGKEHWRRQWQLTEDHTSLEEGKHIALARNGSRVALRAADGWGILDTTTGKEVRRFPRKQLEQEGHFPSLDQTNAKFSGDGQFLVVAEIYRHEKDESRCAVWRVATGALVRKFQLGSKAQLASFALSEDGKTLAALVWAGQEEKHVLRLWDVVQGKQRYAFPWIWEELLDPWDLQFLPDGKELVCRSTRWGKLYLLTTEGKEVRRFLLDGFSSSSVSSDGKRLAAVRANQVLVWDIDSGKKLCQVQAGVSEDVVQGIAALSSDGKTLAVSTEERFRLLDVNAGKVLEPRYGHFDYVGSVAFSATGEHLLTGSPEEGLLLWETKNFQLVRPYPFPVSDEDDGPWRARVHLLTRGGRDAGNRVFPTLRPLEKANLMRATFTPDGKTVIALVSGGELLHWETTTGKTLKWPGKRKRSLTFAVSSNGKLVALSGEDGILQLIQLETGRTLWSTLLANPATIDTKNGQITMPQEPHYLAFSQDNRTLLLAGMQRQFQHGTAVVRKIETQTGLERLRIQQNMPDRLFWERGADLLAVLNLEILGMAVTPDRRTVAVARYGSVKVLDLSKRPSIRAFDGLGVVTATVVFSPDGQLLLAGRRDGGLRVWDVATATVLCDLPAHAEAITALAFSPDGRRLASGSEDSTVLLWDWASMRKRLVANPKVKGG